MLFPLFQRPELGIAVVLLVAIVYLAWKGVVYPLVLVGLVPVLVALLGSNPLPDGISAVLFAAWIMLAIVFALLRKETLPFSILSAAPVVLSLGLGVLLLARLAASPASAYGNAKTQLFLAQNLVLLVAGIMVGRNRRHVDVFFALTLGVALASALVLLHTLLSGQAQEVLPGRFALSPEQNPIFLGRKSADGLIIAIYLTTAAVVLHRRMFALACLPALAAALLAAGSRGPVVGVLAGAVVLLMLLVRSSASRRRIPLVVLAAVLAAGAIATVVPGEATERSLSVLSEAGSGVSSNGRTQLWSDAFEEFAEHPLLGLGTGGFADVAPEHYPHNVLLEVAAELGVAGLVLLFGVMAATLSRVGRAWRRAADDLRPAFAVVLALIGAALVNSLLSGDITVNNNLWLYAGIGVGMASVAGHGRRGSVPERSAEPAVPWP